MQSRQRRRQVSHAGIARKLSKKRRCGRVLACQGATSQRVPAPFGVLAWRSTHPYPATALGALPQRGAWRNSTRRASHRPHPQAVACAFLSEARAMRVFADQWARGAPSLRWATNPHSSKFRNFLSLLPSYHSITSTPHLFPTRQPSSRVRQDAGMCSPAFKSSNFYTCHRFPRHCGRREGVLHAARWEGDVMGRDGQCIVFLGEALEGEYR